jgi:hypothetical protein
LAQLARHANFPAGGRRKLIFVRVSCTVQTSLQGRKEAKRARFMSLDNDKPKKNKDFHCERENFTK